MIKFVRFVASKFEEIFIKHAHTHPNALTYDELKEMITANREPKDFTGRQVCDIHDGNYHFSVIIKEQGSS